MGPSVRANGSDGSTSPTYEQGHGGLYRHKRQRAKQACEPCRLRKRRCDSALPCNMCTQFEYKCYYEKHSRKRSKIVEANALANQDPYGEGEHARPEPPKGDRSTVEDAAKMRSMEANSGIAFTRLLGLRLDPSSGPKLFTFGWNLGSGPLGSASPLVPQVPPITDLLTHDQCFTLATLYFKNVHPLYGFIDQDFFFEQLNLRWTQPAACRLPDHFFAGLAASATMFTDGSFHGVLPRLVDAQKLVLESKSMMQPASLVDVQSWLLRCLYLRVTDHPHAVHMASCVTMHLAEAMGLHQEIGTDTALHLPASDPFEDPEIRRRTFWIARMLNTWVSFEYGRTRVAIRGITADLPSPRDGDYTTDYVSLYSISCCLDPDTTETKAEQWEDFLRRVEEYNARHDGIALSKANLGMCGYRRLRLASPSLSNETTNRIIKMGLKGLEAARRMAERGQAWWHVANVPFQVVCVFLAMDVRESLSHVATAMRTLEFVTQRFGTVTMKDALKTARFLVRLSKKRKDEDSVVLGDCLEKVSTESGLQDDSQALLQAPTTTSESSMPPLSVEETPMTTTSSEDWSLDVLKNSDFDWNFFLTADMPAFNSFAPDGTM